ncbi:pyruvate dehydrogenase [Aureococcus anophagefferens]|nr:pyruvate dehydrogenase [Aureococcus anophagefferens]
MGSDERAKDEREQSSVNEGLRLVALAGLLCFALRTYATLPSTTAFRDATQLDERRGVELELFELEQRQRGIDRELRDLGAAVAATEDAWRGAALTATPRQRQTASGARARDAPPALCAPRRRTPPRAPSRRVDLGPRGPPPDGFFGVLGAPLGNATGSEFHWYGTPPAKACDRARRSGTHFTWEMLNRLGIHSHHEGLGPAGSISWLYAWRARSYAIDNPASLGNRRFCVVLHQVRHPLRVISSVVKATKPRDRFWDWIHRRLLSVGERGAAGAAFEDDASIHGFLDSFYTSRIGIRMIIGQYVALRSPVDDRPDSRVVGLFNTAVNPAVIAEDAVRQATALCERQFGVAPAVKIIGRTDLDFECVPDRLLHPAGAIEELDARVLREAARARRRRARGHQSHRRRRRDNEDVALKISARRRHRGAIARVWSYLYTTASADVQARGFNNDGTDFVGAPLAGLGYGLPISRAYARYYGGDLTLMSMEGFGTDVSSTSRASGTTTSPP